MKEQNLILSKLSDEGLLKDKIQWEDKPRSAMKVNIKNEDFINKLRLGRGIDIVSELIVRTAKSTYAMAMDSVDDFGDSNALPQSLKTIDSSLYDLITKNEKKVFISTRYYNNDYSRYIKMLTFEDFTPDKVMPKVLHDAPDLGAAVMFGFSFERYVVAKAMADRALDDRALSKLARKLDVAPSTLYRTEGEPSKNLKAKIDNLAKRDKFYRYTKQLYDFMKNFDDKGYDDYGYARLADIN